MQVIILSRVLVYQKCRLSTKVTIAENLINAFIVGVILPQFVTVITKSIYILGLSDDFP